MKFAGKRVPGILAAILLVGMGLGTASAQDLDRRVKHLEPGSVLVYPLYTSQGPTNTVIVATNTNSDNRFVPGSDFRAGDVLAHYLYVDQDDWLISDRFELLTAGDTLAVVVDQHNPEGAGDGFLVIIAKDPETEKAIKFDYLIGSAYVAQGQLNFLWQYTAYSFCSNLSDGAPASDAGHRFTQEGPGAVGDGMLTFDGTEYVKFPNSLIVDSFFEEVDPFGNSISFMSTAGAVFQNELGVLIWNNNEQKFSRDYRFVCATTTTLSEIANIVTGLGGDPDEFQRETGWARFNLDRVIDGVGNPKDVGDFGILGVFMQEISGTNFAAGHALHYEGTSANAATLPMK